MFCAQCGKEVSEGQVFCQHCGAKLSGASASLPVNDAVGVSEERKNTSWENRETSGFFNGLFSTLGDVLFHPSDFYKKMMVTGGLTDPLLYALIIGMVGFIFSSLWRIVFQKSMQEIMPWMQSAGELNSFQGVGLALVAFFSPFLIIITLFLISGIQHICLMMVKGAKKSFEATFRVVAYGCSAYIFMIIPLCGGLLWLIWTMVLFIIGLKEAHETSGGKATVAVFLPFIACCGLGLLLAVFMGFAAVSMGSFMHMQQ